MEDLWKEAEGLASACKTISEEIGVCTVELDILRRRQSEIQSAITTKVEQYKIIEHAKNAAIEKIVKASGSEDGDYEIDFANRKVTKKNGQVSSSIDG